jgi:hypothetical protein
MKSYILIAITFCLFACSEDEEGPAANSTVHLAGYIENSGASGEGTLASYWKDSVYTALANPEISSQVSSLYVDGSSVLIGGIKYGGNTPLTSLVWQDGTETVMEEVFGEPMIASRNNNLFGVWLDKTTGWVFHKNGISQPIIDTAYNFGPMSMTLLGDDIYIAGYSSGSVLSPNNTDIPHAQYWKNGELIFRESEVSSGASIFTHNNDIYMAGTVSSANNTSIACYWKNKQRVDLTDGSEDALTRSVFVTDKHVYIAGMMNHQAVYWKDGEMIALTTEGTNSMANSIYVQGENVHVAGYQNGHPAYWKNNVRQHIANQDKLGQIKFMVVGSN